MPLLVLANLAYMVYVAHSVRIQTEHAVDMRTLQHGLQVDGMVAAGEGQQRQFAHNIKQIAFGQELALDLKHWPLVRSPSAVKLSLSQETRRPLLAIFVPPVGMRNPLSLERYNSALKAFTHEHFAGSRGGVKFQTGYWTAGRELDDAAVASLQAHLPDQPMALISFTLFPGDRVEPRIAYLPGPGGMPTEVVPLCNEPLDVGALVRNAERDRSVERKALVRALEAAGFRENEIAQLFGTHAARNSVVERAEQALVAAGSPIELRQVLDDSYVAAQSGMAAAEDSLTHVLKTALLVVADAHNLLTRRLPPRLPELLAGLSQAMPTLAPSLDSALDGYEHLFDFPTLVGTPAVAIARSRLAAARAELAGASADPLDGPRRWAVARGFDAPMSTETALHLFAQHAEPADAGLVETVGVAVEERDGAKAARPFYTLASTLRAKSPLGSSLGFNTDLGNDE